ncbi:MAG TPA: 50S ribosomal protein L10 [Verrucomicrobiae bacterium]|nr:50S ribosomal protein L10 [Verrucomicrobiae bacterium]
MAISREKKQALVTELSELFATAKSTAAAAYAGLSVAELQELRAQAREAEVTIKVVKNRLVRVALGANDTYKDADTSLLTGQLVYAFSATDEVAPAQILAQFAKKHPHLQLVAGFDASGATLSTEAVKALAELPTKEQLRGMVVSTIAAPLTGFLGVANGAQRGFAQVLKQRAEQL